MQLIT